MNQRTEIEYAILCKAIMDQDIAAIITDMDEDDFADQYSRMLWTAVSSVVVNGGEVSFPVVKAELMRLNIPQDAVHIVSASAPKGSMTNSSAVYHIQQLKDISYRASLESMSDNVKSMLADNVPADEIDKVVENTIGRRAGMIRFDELSPTDTLEDMVKNLGLLPSGLSKLDAAIGGLENGELTTIAARPGCGKTTLAHHLLDYWATTLKKSGMLASLEMNKTQTMMRIIAKRIRKTYSDLRRNPAIGNAELAKIIEQWERRVKISIDTSNIKAILQRARYLRRHGKLDFLMVDHIGLVSAEGKNPNERISNITGPLKQFALSSNIPVIAFSQMNREIEKRGGLPSLSDLRDSGSIEQDSNKIIFLHKDKDQNRSFVIAKNTFGPCDQIDYYMESEYYTITTERPYRERRGMMVDDI